MAKKRVTPEADYKRLAENVHLKRGRYIRTKEEFQVQLKSYLHGSKLASDDKLVEKTARYYEKRAGKFQEPSPKMKPQLTEQQASHFKKFAKQVRAKPSQEEFKYLRKERGRTVFAREIMTKKGIRFIDKKGRFTSAIR
jgi:hypothetical protein